MTMKRVIAAAVGGIVLAVTGVAVAANFAANNRQSDFFAPGKHQFYVWCAGGSDYTAMQDGQSAEDAQMRLYNHVKAIGKTSCWPVWQGRISS